ncbi:MAG: DUF4290 domain-containing protein [Schleiferiaceae bacterium]|nr:DUF4290 domain-containing protein [Schleiferiaceae bacterium]
MEYNTSRTELIIPEYGRHVHSMVDHLLTVEDKEKRNQVAQTIIDVIGNLNPHLRDVPDFKHKLWDHLFIMARFKLDVDSPYPTPVPETFSEKPELVNYPDKSNRFRHYGNVIRKMIEIAADLDEGEYRDGLCKALANQMKRHYLEWNKDTVEDDIIFKELEILSKGKISLSGIALDWGAPSPPPGTNNNPKGKSRSNFKAKKTNNRKPHYTKKNK